MESDLLISWRALATLVDNPTSAIDAWLAEGRKTLSILVSQASCYKLSGAVQMPSPLIGSSAAVVDRFLMKHFSAEAIIGYEDVNLDLYSNVKKRWSQEDLETLAIASALARGFKYVCANEIEQREIQEKYPELPVAKLADFVDVS